MKSVEIGLDIRGLDASYKSHKGRGTGRYVSELVPRLCDLANKSASTINFKKLSLEDFSIPLWQKQLINKLPKGKNIIETQVLFPWAMHNLNVDFLHFFAHGDVPSRSTIPYIVTVLDLIPFRFPHLYFSEKYGLRKKLLRHLELRSIKNAVKVISISETTKRDVVNFLGVNEESIEVIPLGVSEKFYPLGNSEKLASNLFVKYGIAKDKPLLIYIGGIDPRKNVFFLIDLLESLSEHNSSLEAQLVLVGRYRDDSHYDKFKAKISNSVVANRVFDLGLVGEKSLRQILGNADAFVFPSLYEGFGLPILEAMAMGIPVVAGRNSSIVEIADGASLLLPDGDLDEWVRAVAHLLNSKEMRVRLSESGLKRAKNYSWSKTAEMTFNIYEEIAGQ